MFESKGKINIVVSDTKKVSDAVCVISFPCNADMALFKYAVNLGTLPSEFVPENYTSTILAWSTYQCCNQILQGSPLATLKTRVSQLTANVSDGCLNLIFNTQANLTYVKKCLQLVIKCLSTNVYGIYDKNCKALGLKPIREEFDKVSAEILGAVANKLEILVVGKVNLIKKIDGKVIPAEKTLGEIRVKLESLLPSGKPSTTKTKTTILTNTLKDSFVLKSSGINAFVLKSYIKAVGGIHSEIVNDSVIITNSNWETIKHKLADKNKIELFIDRKYGNKSLTEHLSVLLGYQIACSGDATASIVKEAVSKKITLSSFEKSLMTSLK